MEDCSNEGEKKQGRRQEQKEEETKDGEDGRRESEWKREKRDESNFIWIPGLKWVRGKHNPLSLSVSTIITSLLLHLE